MAKQQIDIKLKRIPSYVKFVRENTEPVTSIEAGNFYAYNYRFDLNPDFRNLDPRVVKFYDFYPLAFVYDTYVTKDGYHCFRGLNFHHLPVQSRKIWLSRLKTIMNVPLIEAESEDFEVLTIYETLYSMFKKATFGVRNYRFDRVLNLRWMDSIILPQIMEYQAKTYFNVTLSEVAMVYNAFKPGGKQAGGNYVEELYKKFG